MDKDPNLPIEAGDDAALSSRPACPDGDEVTRLAAEVKRLQGDNNFLAARIDDFERLLSDYSERLEEKVRQRTHELEVLNQIATTVSRSLDLDVTLRHSLAKVLEVLQLKMGAIFLAEEESDELRLMAEQGLPGELIERMGSENLPEVCAARVTREGHTMVINDLESEPLSDPVIAYPRFGSVAGVPLQSKGKIRGALCLLSEKKQVFSDDDLSLLVMIGNEVGVAIENAWLYEKSHAHSKKMEELSITEPLTGLFNRRQFYRVLKHEMKRAERQQHALSLLILDLDDLKSYNDRYGHLKGDEILRAVATAISLSIRRDVDSGYRYGGDEFAVILPYSDTSEAAEVGERVRKTFNELGLEGTGLSIGLAELIDDEHVDDFVGRADGAMYTAKNAGGNRLHISEH